MGPHVLSWNVGEIGSPTTAHHGIRKVEDRLATAHLLYPFGGPQDTTPESANWNEASVDFFGGE